MKYLFILIAILSFTHLSAQNDREERKAQIEALRVKFFTTELDLSKEESEKFWPLYYQLEKGLKVHKKAIRSAKKGCSVEGITEQQLRQLLTQISENEIGLSELKEQFILDCLPFLGLEKTAQLVSLEDRFKKKLADKVRNRIDHD